MICVDTYPPKAESEEGNKERQQISLETGKVRLNCRTQRQLSAVFVNTSRCRVSLTCILWTVLLFTDRGSIVLYKPQATQVSQVSPLLWIQGYPVILSPCERQYAHCETFQMSFQLILSRILVPLLCLMDYSRGFQLILTQGPPFWPRSTWGPPLLCRIRHRAMMVVGTPGPGCTTSHLP